MELINSHIRKIDPLLEDELMRAQGDEVLRVIMALGSEGNDQRVVLKEQEPDPNGFSSPTEYRQALIHYRKKYIAEELNPIKKDLSALMLSIHGGESSRIVVVEGAAKRILEALELQSVRSASLDRPIKTVEPVVAQEASHLSNVAIKLLNSGKTSFSGIFSRNLDKRTEEAIFEAFQIYIQDYKRRHGNVKVLNMSYAVPINSLFIEVQVSTITETVPWKSPEDLEATWKDKTEYGFWFNRNRNRISGFELVNTEPYLLLIGDPGAGKTIFLQKIHLEAFKGAEGQLSFSCIPVFVEIRRFVQRAVKIESIINDEFQACGFPNAEEFTKRALESGKFLILFDGVDEVPSGELLQVAEKIQSFVKAYPRNRYISSCRSAAHRSLEPFITAELLNFDRVKIQQFINAWFTTSEDQDLGLAEKCWNALQSAENRTARELAQTPLLLTFLCIVYQHSQSFPRNRGRLFRRVLRILMEDWSHEKQVVQDSILQKLNIDLEEDLLSEIAYKTFETGNLFFYKEKIVNSINSLLSENINVSRELEGKGDLVLNAIAIQQGILLERINNIYSFSHLTLQEYLTAYYVCQHQYETELVKHCLSDERWYEVFILIAGLIPQERVSRLLAEMVDSVTRNSRSAELYSLFNWTSQIVDQSSTDTEKNLIKRVVVLEFALKCAQAQAETSAVSQSLERSIYFTQLLVSKVSRNSSKPFLPPEDFKLSQDVTQALNIAVQYLRIPELAKDNTYTRELEAVINRVGDTASKLSFEIRSNLSRSIANANMEYGEPSSRQRRTDFIFSGLSQKAVAQLASLKSKFPGINKEPGTYQDFARYLYKICLDLFQLDHVSLEFSKIEAEKIEKYLYVHDLIVSFKDSAVDVSKQAWKEIQAKMLK